HRRRLDECGRLDARLEPELVDRLARHDGDDTEWSRLELHLCEQPFALHLADDAAEAVARRQLVRLAPAQAFDLRQRHDAPVRGIALRADSAVAVPAAQRVEGDPEAPRGVACRKERLPRHYIGDPTTRRWRRSASRSQRRPSEPATSATTTDISRSISPPPARWSVSGEIPHVRGAPTYG